MPASLHFIDALPWGLAILAAAVAAICDIRTRRIPNLLTFPLLLGGVLYAILIGGGEGLMRGVAGCLVLGIPYVLLFVFAGGGAGDAKMMGALGMWLGVPASVPVLVAVALAGGVLSLGYALLRGRLAATFANLRQLLWGCGMWTVNRAKLSEAQAFIPPKERMLPMPYGLAIFAGTLGAAGWVMLWA